MNILIITITILIIWIIFYLFNCFLNNLELDNFKDFIKRSLLNKKLNKMWIDSFVNKIHFDDRWMKVPYVSLREFYFPKDNMYNIDLTKVYMLYYTNIYYIKKVDLYENKDFVKRYWFLINEYEQEFFNEEKWYNEKDREKYVFIKLWITMIDYYNELEAYEKNLFWLKK